ncbi:MAG TPA: hypothetical protein VIH33_07795 [Candidatus Limnocylindria bacterium]|jgi:hypothetical protein
MKILAVEIKEGKEVMMFQFLDPLALRLQGEARRAELRASMQAARGGTVRRRFGGWLVGLGERLAREDATLQPATDWR